MPFNGEYACNLGIEIETWKLYIWSDTYTKRMSLCIQFWRSPIHGASAPRFAYFLVEFTPAAQAHPAHPLP
eukprot:210160-Pelagomonas_calceolata.AAC.2